MKAGIVTFHRAINYGAILQSYALHNVLKEHFKIENNIIDYRCRYLEDEYKIINRYKYCGNYKGKIIFTLNLPSFVGKKIKFRIFLRKNIPLGKIKALEKYDTYITGSDQVWNFKNTDDDPFYFLDFVKTTKKKNSYAASFGFDEIPKDRIEKYSKLLSSFNNISVRESQGALIIRQLLRKNIPVVLDPTLLLDKKDWIKLCHNKVKIKNYILVFGVYFSPNIAFFVKKLQNFTGCKVAIINDNVIENIKLVGSFGIGPKEFIELFARASYVVTNSYHGTAFSINFRKNFFVELQQAYSYNTNSRITNLLDIFHLNDRIITNSSDENLLRPVNYKDTDTIFETERNKALNYLKDTTTCE